jgi:GTP-binding protein LepA
MVRENKNNKIQDIRNFSIIAHIDHGKSTLSDRFLEMTGLKTKRRNPTDRVLDVLDLEQEKGITIKLQAVRMKYKDHILNLIDTPGHVDFSYEVSRSLKACEGAILLVDASQGVQAQTLSTLRKARKLGLEIIPVLNKIDLENINIEERKKELTQMLGFKQEEVLLASGKSGKGAEEILDTVIEKVPSPQSTATEESKDSSAKDAGNNLQALIFDSFYHEHKGVIAAIRVFSGTINARNTRQLHLLRNGNSFEPREIGFFSPGLTKCKQISAGEVGYIATGVKDIRLFTVGDTISNNPKGHPLPGYKPPQPRVFATVFPSETDDFPVLSESITKLSMNDAAFTASQRKSSILGSGFRCGFLGMLHMEIIQERLEREYDVSLVITAPSVEYQVDLITGETESLQTASDYPNPTQIKEIREPWAEVEIFTPQKYMGPIMDLCQDARGEYQDMDYVSSTQDFSLNYILIKYEIPLMALITNFFNNLKAVSSGYASLEYDIIGYKAADIVKVSILVNKEEIESLDFLEIRSKAEQRSRSVLKALKKNIPKHQFQIALQAAIGGKIIAREDVPALRKDVTAKLYGGDVTRKKKLLKQQRKGKKRLKEISGVNIPQKAFMSVLET